MATATATRGGSTTATAPFGPLLGAVLVVFAACSGPVTPSAAPSASGGSVSSAPSTSGPASPAPAATVRLQLEASPRAQFAGYFAADRKGYYKAENLRVTMLPGGADVVPQQVGSAPDGPEFTISWVPKVLQAREGGSDLVDIAQVFQRSGTVSVTWKDTGIDDPCKLAGKKVGTWGHGDEFEVTAGLLRCGLTPGLESSGKPDSRYQQVVQASDMKAFLAREIDAAEAMIYDEYAEVLETTDPATGQLYKPAQLNVLDWNAYRVAMLQDAIFARRAWLDEATNRDVAVRFIRASVKGWIYCRDHPDDCVQYAIEAGRQLRAGHQAWMMNEVNALVWPSPVGVGMVDPILWAQTVKIARGAGIIKADPGTAAYRTDLIAQALAGITDDTKDTGFKKVTVVVTPGGN
jgi:NitT/TauT family transport system substrate-binding protein